MPQRTCAVADLLDRDIQLGEQRHIQIGQWGLICIPDVTPPAELSGARTSQEDW